MMPQIRYSPESTRLPSGRFKGQWLGWHSIHIVWLVNANFDNWNDERGWNFNAYQADSSNEWNEDRQVVSRYSYFSCPALLIGGEVFCNEASFPSSGHATNFFDI